MWCLDYILVCENLLWLKKEIILYNIFINIIILNYMKRIFNCKGSLYVIIFVFIFCLFSLINFFLNQVKVYKLFVKKYVKNFIIFIMYIFIKYNVL